MSAFWKTNIYFFFFFFPKKLLNANKLAKRVGTKILNKCEEFFFEIKLRFM